MCAKLILPEKIEMYWIISVDLIYLECCSSLVLRMHELFTI